MTDARCSVCRRRLRWDNSTGAGYCPVHESQFAAEPNPIPVEVELQAQLSDRSVWAILAEQLNADERVVVRETIADLDPERVADLERLGEERDLATPTKDGEPV